MRSDEEGVCGDGLMMTALPASKEGMMELTWVKSARLGLGVNINYLHYAYKGTVYMTLQHHNEDKERENAHVPRRNDENDAERFFA